MANVLKKNIQVLKRFNPLLPPVLFQSGTIENLEENVYIKEGALYLKEKEKEYRLVSSNKEQEAEWIMRDMDECRDYLVMLFGMANIALLNRLYLKTSPGTRILVFEPNLYVLNYVLRKENLVDIISSGKFAFIYGDDSYIKKSIKVYMGQKWENMVQNSVALSLPNYYIYQDYCNSCVQMVSDDIVHNLKRLGNDFTDVLDGLINHMKNVDTCLSCNGMRELEGKFEGMPAIIVASGPSLDKNIAYLKEAQNKAVILSCDASYQACIQNGVKPDAIISIERGYPTYQFFFKDRELDPDVVLMGPGLLWPEIFEEYPGKKVLISKSSIGLEDWWARQFEMIQYIDMGHSCATAALSIAKELGCSPIIAIGQDLAFTDNKIHGDQAHTEWEGENKAVETSEEEAVWVEDIYGGKVRTNPVYNLFRYFFEESISLYNLHFIDATEGGAKIQGSEIKTLKETIEQFCVSELPYHLTNLLADRDITQEDYLKKYDEVIANAEDAIEQFNEVQDKVVEHFNELLKYENYDFEHASDEELYQIVINMKQADELVTFLIEEKQDLVTYYQQVVKQTIIYVKKIGNRLTAEAVKRNWVLQVNLMQLVDITSAATTQKLRELIAFVEEKKKKRMEEIA